jgi:hypothetical protein
MKKIAPAKSAFIVWFVFLAHSVFPLHHHGIVQLAAAAQSKAPASPIEANSTTRNESMIYQIDRAWCFVRRAYERALYASHRTATSSGLFGSLASVDGKTQKVRQRLGYFNRRDRKFQAVAFPKTQFNLAKLLRIKPIADFPAYCLAWLDLNVPVCFGTNGCANRPEEDTRQW